MSTLTSGSGPAGEHLYEQGRRHDRQSRVRFQLYAVRAGWQVAHVVRSAEEVALCGRPMPDRFVTVRSSTSPAGTGAVPRVPKCAPGVGGAEPVSRLPYARCPSDASVPESPGQRGTALVRCARTLSWVSLATPIVATRSPPVTAAISMAIPTATEPDQPRKWMTTVVGFCRMKTMSTTDSRSATMMAAQAALARVDRGARSAGDVPPEAPSRVVGDGAAGLVATTRCPVTGTMAFGPVSVASGVEGPVRGPRGGRRQPRVHRGCSRGSCCSRGS